MNDFKKVVRIGSVLPWSGAGERADVFCKIEYVGGRFSITGVVGPTKGGNSRGGCGQIQGGFAHRDMTDNDRREKHPTTPDEITFAPGWNADLWLDFLDVWQRWHLNTLRAGCEHQRALPEFQPREVELYKARV